MASNNPLVEAVPSEKFITPARGFANESSPPASSSASAGKASGAGGGEKGKEGKKDKKDKKKKGKKGMIDTAPCIGTRDFPPQEMIKRDWYVSNNGGKAPSKLPSSSPPCYVKHVLF